MSDVEHMSRKELLQPNQMEKKLYEFADHAYRKKQLYISAAVGAFVLIFGVWGIWQYMSMQRIEEANRFHQAQSLFYNPNLSEQERKSRGITALQKFAKTDSDSVLSVLALMTSGEVLAKESQTAEAIIIFQKVQNHPSASSFHKNVARLSLAAIYEQLEDWANAQTALQSISDTEWNDVKWRAMSRIAGTQGKIDKAKELLTQLINITPESPFKSEAETLLLTY